MVDIWPWSKQTGVRDHPSRGCTGPPIQRVYGTTHGYLALGQINVDFSQFCSKSGFSGILANFAQKSGFSGIYLAQGQITVRVQKGGN